nr:potassium channel subfamily U member 1 [Chlorocebus sabaeus]
MFQTKLRNESWEDSQKMSCTTEIQVAFILSSFMTFISGLVILLIFRLIWRTVKKWQIIKGTGIILELFTSGSIPRNHVRSLHFQGRFRDRIEMLLSAQTFVGQVLTLYAKNQERPGSGERLKIQNLFILKHFRAIGHLTVFSVCSSIKHQQNSSINTEVTFLHDVEQDSDQLDSSGMFHWCKPISLDKVTLKRSRKLKHKFRNHIVACVFGDAQSALIGLRNFVMPLRASNYTRKELKDIVFIGSLDYLQREWRFLRNFPQIYILPGCALYSGDLHAANIEQCSMCVVLSPPSKPSSSQTLVDTEAILATLTIGSLQIDSSSDSSPSVSEETASYTNGHNEKPNCRKVPILIELKNPSNIHFIEQLGGLEGSLQETNLHLSTAFSTGTVFSGSFLDSLLATAFYNYRVLELLQMLVTGGVSSQLEQHLDKDKVYGVADSCTTLLSGRNRCKMGLLSLHQTILSDVNPRNTFGQLFCGSLDLFGILCVGLYRIIDEEELNPENKREVFVITRPANEFKLLPSDLVFCAIPFSTACYKRNEEFSSQKSYEIISEASQTTETHSDTNFPPTIYSVDETLYSPVYPYQSRTNSVSSAKQTAWNQIRTNSSITSQKPLGDNAKENGKKISDEISDEDPFAYSEPL